MSTASSSWIANTIERLFDPAEPTKLPAIETLEIVVKAVGQTATECKREMEEGWITSIVDSLGIFASASNFWTDNTRGGRRARWKLRELVVVVCVDERIFPPTGPSRDEQSILVSEIRNHLVAAFSTIDPSVTVCVESIRDRFYRWLRYPSIPHADLHY